jgi:hypothetical protein
VYNVHMPKTYKTFLYILGPSLEKRHSHLQKYSSQQIQKIILA